MSSFQRNIFLPGGKHGTLYLNFIVMLRNILSYISARANITVKDKKIAPIRSKIQPTVSSLEQGASEEESNKSARNIVHVLHSVSENLSEKLTRNSSQAGITQIDSADSAPAVSSSQSASQKKDRGIKIQVI